MDTSLLFKENKQKAPGFFLKRPVSTESARYACTPWTSNKLCRTQLVIENLTRQSSFGNASFYVQWNHFYLIKIMLVYFAGNWFVALKCKTMHFFAKRIDWTYGNRDRRISLISPALLFEISSIFSSPDPKAQGSFSYQILSVVVVVVNFSHFVFFKIIVPLSTRLLG